MYRKKLVLILGILFLFMPIGVGAADSEDETFFVKPVIDESQKDKTNDYFNLKLDKGVKKKYTVEVYNQTNDTKSFATEIQNSITNDYGVIEYKSDNEIKEYDPSLKYKFTDISTILNSKVTVPAKSVGKVEFEIEMPSEKYDGQVLGGIRVSEVKTGKQTGAISNLFSYVIPVKVYNNDVVIPNKLNFKGVSVGQQDFENVIKAKLQNPQPEILRDLTLETKIYQSGKKDVLYSDKKENLKVAPNTSFHNTISLGSDKFKPGKYRIELVANANELSKKWEEEFEITAKEAKELNEKMFFKKEKKIPIWSYLLGIALLLAIVYIIWDKKIKGNKKNTVSDSSDSLLDKNDTEDNPMTNDKKRKRKRKTHSDKFIILIVASSSLFGGLTGLAMEEDKMSTATIKIIKEGTNDSSTEVSSTENSKETETSHSKEETTETIIKDSAGGNTDNSSEKRTNNRVKGEYVPAPNLPKTNEQRTNMTGWFGIAICLASIKFFFKDRKTN